MKKNLDNPKPPTESEMAASMLGFTAFAGLLIIGWILLVHP